MRLRQKGFSNTMLTTSVPDAISGAHRAGSIRRLIDRLEAKRREADEAGQAQAQLIIVAVVLVLTIILLAVLVPVFLGLRNTANNRNAQSTLENAATVAKGVYANSESYTNISTAELTSAEPQIHWLSGSASVTDDHEVFFAPGTGGQSIELMTASASGKCFAAWDIETSSSSAVSAADGRTDAGLFFNVGNSNKGSCALADIPTTGWVSSIKKLP